MTPAVSDGADYYAALGLTRSATADAVSNAYRTAALKHHPDKNDGDDKDVETRMAAAENFASVAEAYYVLSKPKLKAVYDLKGEEGLKDAGLLSDVSASASCKLCALGRARAHARAPQARRVALRLAAMTRSAGALAGMR